jgi:hypothetical protein
LDYSHRINIALPSLLRKYHQLALPDSQFQSERIEALLRADLIHYQKHGELLPLDCDRKIGDLLPRNYGKIRRIASHTGIPEERLLAIRNREISEQDLLDAEIEMLARYFNRPVEELKQLQANDYPY